MLYRTLILRRLAKLERAIEIGEQAIAEQRLRVERANQEGLMVAAHSATLRRLHAAHAVQLSARDRLRADLYALNETRAARR